MAFGEDLLKGEGIASGIGFGVGLALLAPIVVPVVGAIARPIAKGAIKMGMMAYDAAAEGFSNVADTAGKAAGGSTLGSLFTEARQEVDQSRTTRTETTREKPTTHTPGSRTAAAAG
jgi:hypothetical protein